MQSINLKIVNGFCSYVRQYNCCERFDYIKCQGKYIWKQKKQVFHLITSKLFIVFQLHHRIYSCGRCGGVFDFYIDHFNDYRIKFTRINIFPWNATAH